VLVEFRDTRVLCTARWKTVCRDFCAARGAAGHRRVRHAAAATNTRTERERRAASSLAARRRSRRPDRPQPAAVADLSLLGERSVRSTATCCRPTGRHAHGQHPHGAYVAAHDAFYHAAHAARV